MDFVRALKIGNDEIVSCVKNRIDPLDKEQRDTFESIVASLEQNFISLLSDEECETDRPEFRVPELPKPKGGKQKSRGKQQISGTSSKKSYEVQKHEYVTSSADVSLDSVDSTELVRKSSRLASKASQVLKQEISVAIQSLANDKVTCNETFIIPPVISTLPTNKAESETQLSQIKRSSRFPIKVESVVVEHPQMKRGSFRIVHNSVKTAECTTTANDETTWSTAKEGLSEPASPSLPPSKIRCIEHVNSGKTTTIRHILDMSMISAGIKDEPLGSSTPTSSLLETCKKDQLTPKPNDVAKGAQVTPKQTDTGKKAKMKGNTIFTEESLSAIKGTRTRNQYKILQEKNTNVHVRMIEEKCLEAQKKKEDIIKSSAEEAKRKREERARKVAACREAAMQEKKKQLIQKQEIEREMKLKQKDEKLRIEMLKKKHLVAMKHTEIEKRQKDEDTKLQKTKKPDPKSEPMEYPLDNVLESCSSDEEDRPKSRVPSWATKENRKVPLLIQAYLDKKETVRPWFFNPSLKYPKLEILFEGVNLKGRPRASSAFWNTVVDFEEAFPLHD